VDHFSREGEAPSAKETKDMPRDSSTSGSGLARVALTVVGLIAAFLVLRFVIGAAMSILKWIFIIAAIGVVAWLFLRDSGSGKDSGSGRSG